MNAQTGIALHLTIGQHVRHRDFHGNRVTGVVTGLSIEEGSLQADIVLDRPIVISGHGGPSINIWRQHVPAHELVPFDERDEVITELSDALQAMVNHHGGVAKAADQRLLEASYKALTKAGTLNSAT